MNKSFKITPINTGFSGQAMQLQVNIDPARVHGEKLEIMTASGFEEQGGYCPAESVTVHGRQALIALRDALIEAFPL